MALRLNSGELEREYDEIIREQRDGTREGDLRSSLCALVFLIGKLPRKPPADDGVRANVETLVDLLVADLKADRPKLEQQVTDTKPAGEADCANSFRVPPCAGSHGLGARRETGAVAGGELPQVSLSKSSRVSGLRVARYEGPVRRCAPPLRRDWCPRAG